MSGDLITEEVIGAFEVALDAQTWPDGGPVVPLGARQMRAVRAALEAVAPLIADRRAELAEQQVQSQALAGLSVAETMRAASYEAVLRERDAAVAQVQRVRDLLIEAHRVGPAGPGGVVMYADSIARVLDGGAS